MNNKQFLGDDDLISNTANRLAVCLCLDISGSMSKNNAIGQLNKGVATFYEAVMSNEQARLSCEIAIVTFNGEVKVEEEFSSVDQKIAPTYVAEGGTALAHAVQKSLNLLQDRKNDYKKNGINYYQPWLVIITDGKPGDKEYIPEAQQRVKDLLEKNSLVIWPLAVGNDEDENKYHEIMDVLNGFCLKPKAIHLKNLKFEEFFEWLGKSVSAVSQSKTTEKVKLDNSSMDDWGEI